MFRGKILIVNCQILVVLKIFFYILRPKHTSTIRTNYRNEFAHCLEPWIGKMLKEPCKGTLFKHYINI